jgi:type I restriction enzyme M protein
VDGLNYKEQPLVFTTADARYWYDAERETLVKECDDKQQALGCGRIIVKATYKKETKKQAAQIEMSVELTPDTEKDYEIIPFARDEADNQVAINAFLAKYVTRPFEYLENTVGVEINFNKVFYQPEKLRATADILDEIGRIDDKLKSLESTLSL